MKISYQSFAGLTEGARFLIRAGVKPEDKKRIQMFTPMATPTEQEKHERMNAILQAVCESLQIEEARLLSKSRKRPLVVARQIFFYFSRTKTKATLEEAASFIGKDHATVIHSVKKVSSAIEVPKSDEVIYTAYCLCIDKINEIKL